MGALAGSFGFPWAFAPMAVFPVLAPWLGAVEGEGRAAQLAINYMGGELNLSVQRHALERHGQPD